MRVLLCMISFADEEFTPKLFRIINSYKPLSSNWIFKIFISLLFGSLWKIYLFCPRDGLIIFPLWYQIILLSNEDEYLQENKAFSLLSQIKSFKCVKIWGFKCLVSLSFLRLLVKSIDWNVKFVFCIESKERQTVV